jgi:hypothetical protein
MTTWKIPRRFGVDNELYAYKCEPTDNLDWLIARAEARLMDNLDEKSLLATGNPEEIMEYIKQNPEAALIEFRDEFDIERGVAVFSVAPCWYNQKIKAIQEELTVGFTSGFTEIVVQFMEEVARINKDINLICAAVANHNVSDKVTHVYQKHGFKTFNTFYKQVKELD